MKYYLAKLILKFDKFIHKKFDFLNLNKLGKFATNYEWIFPYLYEDIDELNNKTFIEVGSRDAYDSLGLIEKFNFSYGYIFEPSYTGIIKCIENLKLHRKFSKKLSLFPFALGRRNGLETFYEYRYFTKNDNVPNYGASTFNSISNESNISYEVPMYELDKLNLDLTNNYLIIMDCEGSELDVIQGSKNSICFTKYISLETTSKLSIEIKGLLENLDFKLIDCDWKNTIKGELPKFSDVKNSKFNLLFKNLNNK